MGEQLLWEPTLQIILWNSPILGTRNGQEGVIFKSHWYLGPRTGFIWALGGQRPVQHLELERSAKNPRHIGQLPTLHRQNTSNRIVHRPLPWKKPFSPVQPRATSLASLPHENPLNQPKLRFLRVMPFSAFLLLNSTDVFMSIYVKIYDNISTLAVWAFPHTLMILLVHFYGLILLI